MRPVFRFRPWFLYFGVGSSLPRMHRILIFSAMANSLETFSGKPVTSFIRSCFWAVLCMAIRGGSASKRTAVASHRKAVNYIHMYTSGNSQLFFSVLSDTAKTQRDNDGYGCSGI